MLAYEVIKGGAVLRGLPIKHGAILVGEEGRGRKLVRAPLPKGASVEEGRMVSAPLRESEGAIILIRDQSGFRGWWQIEAEDGSDLPPAAIGRVIAEGRCAQGDAGYMGGGPEYLIAARPGRFVIRRGGRLYGAPKRLVVTVTADGAVTVADADEPSAEW